MRSHILLGRVLRPSIRANSPRSLNPRTQDLIVLGLYSADWISPSCSRGASLGFGDSKPRPEGWPRFVVAGECGMSIAVASQYFLHNF
jgi:hypothetical protein